MIMKKIKKQAVWLLIVGTFCMSFSIITRHFINTPESVEDFFKGFGWVLMMAGLIKLLKNSLQTQKQQQCDKLNFTDSN